MKHLLYSCVSATTGKANLLTCCGLNCVSPKNRCWSPNPQNVWMWPHLEIGSLQVQSQVMSCWIRVGPKSSDWCSYKKRTRDRHRWEYTVWKQRQRLQWCMYKPRTASDHQKPVVRHGRNFSSQPLEGTNSTDTWILDYTLQNWENEFLSHLVCGTFLWEPQETNA